MQVVCPNTPFAYYYSIHTLCAGRLCCATDQHITECSGRHVDTRVHIGFQAGLRKFSRNEKGHDARPEDVGKTVEALYYLEEMSCCKCRELGSALRVVA